MNISEIIKESIKTKERFLHNKKNLDKISLIANECVLAFNSGGKVLFCGNGGSASDAQHLAAELSGRFEIDRAPLYAEALHVNSSYITAVANDYSYDMVYSRMVEAAGKPGDVLIGITTSGNSSNVVKAMEKAGEIGMRCFGLSGSDGGKMNDVCDINIVVPSDNTARIQETHILIGHIVCQIIENKIFQDKNDGRIS
ncbi:MAG: D-sedoheptulose 7-phosphate isomerase [Chlorobi bacterium]|nr:D-sedoheptulose 7-phosphate isomerase [Chlorobiota bacterium]